MQGEQLTPAFDDPSTLARLTRLIRVRIGVELNGKEALIRNRLQSLLRDRGIVALDTLCDLAERSGGNDGLVAELFDRLTTHHTFFFRDTWQFAPLVEEALHRGPGTSLRVWCAGCSTGEEPYSLAMILAEALGCESLQRSVSILATDVSRPAVDYAERGVYPVQAAEQIPSSLRDRYTRPTEDGTFTVRNDLKRRIVFRQLNLQTPDYPLRGPFDWIVCRNVFIYFRPPTRDSVAAKFARVARVGAGLVLGSTEALAGQHPNWASVGSHVYRRRA